MPVGGARQVAETRAADWKVQAQGGTSFRVELKTRVEDPVLPLETLPLLIHF